MISVLLLTPCVRVVLVVLAYVLSVGLLSPAVGQSPSVSYHHDSVYIQPQNAPYGSYVVEDISQHSNKEKVSHDRSNQPQNEAKDPDMILININTGPHPPGLDEIQPDTVIGPDEMYYFAPKNPQNNKSSIVGQRLDVTIFDDFLNTAPDKHRNRLDFYKVPYLNNLVLPLRATFSAAISIFNPYSEVLQVVKVFGGGPGFHLSLPSGQMEDQRNVWDIMPYQTKPLIRFTFSERSKKNHSTKIGLFLSNHEYINVPINIVMVSKPGLYSSEHIIDFGVASRNGLVTSKALNLCNSAKSSIIVQNVTSDCHFVTVDFPHEVEVPPQSCTASQVAHISYHWDYVGYSYGEIHFGQLTVKSNKGNELNIPYHGRTLEGDLVYEEQSLHFVMSKAIRSTSIIKIFTLLNNFSSTPVAISQIGVPKNATQYFKIRDFSPVVLKPGQNKTLFRVGYVNPNNSKMDIISYLEFKTNASDFTIPLMVYDGQLAQVLPATNIITLPPIRISSPRHTYIVVANENPVAIMIKDWGTTYTPHVSLNLVEIGKFNSSMRRNSADSWSRPMIREDQIPAPVALPVKHYAIYQLLVSTPNPDQNLTVKIWIQTQHQHYSIPLKVSVFDKNLQVIAEPLVFENCHPGAVCTAEVNVMSWLDRTLALTSVTSEFVSENVRFVPTRPSLIQPQMVSLVGHIEWIPTHHKNSSGWIGLFSKAERAMWLSSFHLTNSSETSYMDFSWFYRRMGKYYAEEDNRTLRHQFTLETGGAETCQFSVHLHLKWPKFIQEPGENRQQTTFELPTMEVKGKPYYQKILVKNTFHTQNITLHLAMYPYPYWCNITEFIDLFEHEVNSLLLSQDDWELVMNNTSPYRRKVLNVKNSVYVPHKRTMIFVLPPQKELEILVRFQPKKPGVSTSILFIRNDVSILESILLKGMGAYPVLSFGSKRKLPPLVFDMESSPMVDLICSKNKTSLPSETRIFLIKNPGKHTVRITSMTINSVLCSGYGFRIIDCRQFSLLPNQSKEVSVEFTADFTLKSVIRQLEINTEETIGSDTTNRIFIYQLWGIVPSEWELCKDKYTWQEFRRGDSWARPEWESSIGQIMLVAAGILMVVAWLVSIAAVHTIDKEFLAKNLGPPCVGAHGKRSFQSVVPPTGSAKKTDFKNSKHKEGNEEKRTEIIPDPTSLGISQSENSYIKPSDSTPIWSFTLRDIEPEPEPKPEKDRNSRSDYHPKEKTKRRYLTQETSDSAPKNNVSAWQTARNRSPALVIDNQLNKNPKADEGKFEVENRRRAEKILKKQYGLKPVDSWRKHKKALNAAKYYDELPEEEKNNSNQESKVPIEIKPEPKPLKNGKMHKKISAISLPIIKQDNNKESGILLLNSSSTEVGKKPIASVAPYQINLPKQPIVQSERSIEKFYNSKSKSILAAQNKIEKEPVTIRPVISKKSISDDDGLLAEYKYTKKKNKTERKASLTPSMPPALVAPPVVKPKIQTVERFSSPDIIKPKVHAVERLIKSPEIIKPKIQNVESFTKPPETPKPKIRTPERFIKSPEIIKPKIEIVESFTKPPETPKPKIRTPEKFIKSPEIIKPKIQIVESFTKPPETPKSKIQTVERFIKSPEIIKPKIEIVESFTKPPETPKPKIQTPERFIKSPEIIKPKIEIVESFTKPLETPKPNIQTVEKFIKPPEIIKPKIEIVESFTETPKPNIQTVEKFIKPPEIIKPKIEIVESFTETPKPNIQTVEKFIKPPEIIKSKIEIVESFTKPPETPKPNIQTPEKFIKPPEIIKPKAQIVERFNISPDIIKPMVQTVERFNSSEVIKPKVQNVEKLNLSEVIQPNVQTVEHFNSPEEIKPKIETVERFNSPEVIKPKVQNVEKLNLSEVIQPNVQTVEHFNSPEEIKPKIQTVERFNSPEVIKPKVQNVEKLNLSEVIQPNVQTVERSNSPEVIKPKVQTVERGTSPDMVKLKVHTVERCTSPELMVHTVEISNLSEIKPIVNIYKRLDFPEEINTKIETVEKLILSEEIKAGNVETIDIFNLSEEEIEKVQTVKKLNSPEAIKPMVQIQEELNSTEVIQSNVTEVIQSNVTEVIQPKVQTIEKLNLTEVIQVQTTEISNPQEIIKPNFETVEICTLPETSTPNILAMVKSNLSEMIKPNVQTAEMCDILDVVKLNVETVEKCNSSDIKPKILTVERCDPSLVINLEVETSAEAEENCTSLAITQHNINDVVVPPNTEEELEEDTDILPLNEPQTDEHSEIEEIITVLKVDSDEDNLELLPSSANKHGPVGSGRDRKNEDKITKCESSLVLVETIKEESEPEISIIDTTEAATSTSNCENPTNIMAFSTNDPGYNLWTSFVWGPVYGQSTKNPSPQK